MARDNVIAHVVEKGETVTSISADVLKQAFGAPHTQAEWVDRANQVAIEKDAVAARNDLFKPPFAKSGEDNDHLKPLKLYQILFVPNPEELFSK